MKDNRLKTSFENYQAFDHIAGSSFGTWTDRETACAMVEFLDGSIERHPDYERLLKDVAETSDEDMCDLVTELGQDVADCIYGDDWHYLAFHDNEFMVMPAVESVLEEHRESGDIGDETPDADSTRPVGSTFVTVNDHGNVSLYRMAGTVEGWQEIWVVV